MQEFSNLDGLGTIAQNLDRAEVRPITVGNDPVNPNGRSTDEYRAIWNTSRDMLESVVKANKSMLIQHQDAIGSLVRALRGKVDDISGNVENNGGEVVVRVDFNNTKIETPKDVITMGIRLRNNYARGSMSGQGHAIRDVCDNGMFLSSVTNTIGSKHNTVESLDKNMSQFVQKVLANTKKVEKVLVKARQDKFENLDHMQEVAIAGVKNRNKAKKIMELLEDRQDLSRYTLYNALTNYATHLSNNDYEKNKVQAVAQMVLIRSVDKLRREDLEEEI